MSLLLVCMLNMNGSGTCTKKMYTSDKICKQQSFKWWADSAFRAWTACYPQPNMPQVTEKKGTNP